MNPDPPAPSPLSNEYVNQGQAGLKLEEDCDSPQIHQKSLVDPSGPAGALSMAQFEEVDDTHFAQHRASPIMLLISSPLLVSFNFHAKVLASLIPS